MMENGSFGGLHLPAGTWVSGVFYGALGCAALMLLVLWRVRRDWDRSRYHNLLAWLRAGVWFCFCFAASAVTGVLEAVWAGPYDLTSRFANPAWVAASATFLVVVVHGYFIAWPKGTYYEDRKLYWTATPFGLVWGVAEAHLHLCGWAVLTMLGAEGVFAALGQVGFMTLTFPWHVLYWDRYVSPAHNILEWNPRKVLLAHLPNTLVATAFLFLLRDPKTYVLIECLSLLASARAQRFPPPWRSEWHGRPILKEGGVPAAALGLDARSLMPLREAPGKVETQRAG